MVKVGIVMGSISDKPVMEECEKMLESCKDSDDSAREHYEAI